jgi:hypothetical protein
VAPCPTFPRCPPAGLESLVRRAGLTERRWFRQMERPLTDLPAPPPAVGFEIVPFSSDRDDEVRRAHNTAFVDHHGSSERDPEAWRSLFTGQRAFRPDLSILALADGAPLTDVWVLLSVSYFAPTAGPAWVGTVHLMSHANDLTDEQ